MVCQLGDPGEGSNKLGLNVATERKAFGRSAENSRKHAADSRRHAADSRRHAADSRRYY